MVSNCARTQFPCFRRAATFATPAGGITAEVAVVRDFAELTTRRHKAKEDCSFPVPFTRYGATVRYRSEGAIRAAEVDAVASPYGLWHPIPCELHTGGMRYQDSIPKFLTPRLQQKMLILSPI